MAEDAMKKNTIHERRKCRVGVKNTIDEVGSFLSAAKNVHALRVMSADRPSFRARGPSPPFSLLCTYSTKMSF